MTFDVLAPARWAAQKLHDVTARFALTAHSALTPENERYWNELGQRSLQDLKPWDQKKMQEDAGRAFQRYGLCRRATEITKGFTVGAIPVRPTAKHKRTQELLDQFWDDPENHVEDSVAEWALDLSVHGEIAIIVARGETSRLTRIGQLDPQRISRVLTDPENARKRVAVLTKTADVVRAYPIVQRDGELAEPFRHVDPGTKLEVVDETAGKLQVIVGQPVVFKRINALSTQTRGVADAYPALDAMRLRDRGLFSFMERLGLIGAFIWDLALPNSLKAKDVTAATEAAAKAIGRGSGGVYGHTKNQELTPQSPDIKSADWSEGLRLPLLDILTTFGHPEHWYASGGGDLSNASAGEMGSPTWTALQDRQNVLRQLVMEVGNYALRQIPETRAMSPEELEWEPTLPTIVGKDALRESTVLMQQANFLATAQESFGLKPEAARRELIRVGGEYGFELAEEDFDKGFQALRGTVPFPTLGGPDEHDPVNKQMKGDGAGKLTAEGEHSDSGHQPKATKAA